MSNEFYVLDSNHFHKYFEFKNSIRDQNRLTYEDFKEYHRELFNFWKNHYQEEAKKEFNNLIEYQESVFMNNMNDIESTLYDYLLYEIELQLDRVLIN